MTRIAILRKAFRNWWLPAVAGSVAYRLRRFPGLFTQLMNSELRLRTRSGPTLLARLRDLGGPMDVFGAAEYDVHQINRSEVRFVLDIGAHVGSFSLWAMTGNECLVVAIEPNPDTFALLERNLQHEGGRARCVQLGVAAEPGQRRLKLAEDSAANTLSASGDSDPGVAVRVITLADALELAGFPQVDLLKLDIEGSEYEVFRSLRRGALEGVTAMVIECHGDRVEDTAAISDRLRGEGFEVFLERKSSELLLLVARQTRLPAGLIP